MLCRTALPLSKALPFTTRLIVIRSTAYPVAIRSFHFSSIQNADSKATYATVAPEKPSSATSNALPPPSKDDKTVAAKVDAKQVIPDVHEKRDFHWSHPVYTREEYEAIQVRLIYNCKTDFLRLVIMKLVRLVNTSPLQLQNFFVPVLISLLDTNTLQVNIDTSNTDC